VYFVDVHVLCNICLMCVDDSMSAVQSELQNDGFTEVTDEAEFYDKTFMLDDQCSDVMSFPNELISYIEKHPLVASGALVLQVSMSNTLHWNKACDNVTVTVFI